jgi:hypothetical protein
MWTTNKSANGQQTGTAALCAICASSPDSAERSGSKATCGAGSCGSTSAKTCGANIAQEIVASPATGADPECAGCLLGDLDCTASHPCAYRIEVL